MKEYTSKRAQEIQAKKAAELEDDISNLKTSLADLSMKIESAIENNDDTAKDISRFKHDFILLKPLAPNDPIIPFYEAKPKEWKEKEIWSWVKFAIGIGILLLIALCAALMDKLTNS